MKYLNCFKNRSVIGMGVSLGMALGLSGAALNAVAQSPAPAGIVVYNAQHASLVEAWAEGFTKETGIKVTMRRGGDMEMVNQIFRRL